MSYKSFFVFLSVCVLLPSVAMCQVDDKKDKGKDKKSVVKINHLDVIYEDDEYTGIVVDQKNNGDDGYFYQAPYMVEPPPMEEDEEQPRLLQPIDDEGAESEDDILYASFDSEVIHYPKMNVADMHDTTIRLVNPAKGMNYSYPTPETSRATSHFGPRRRRFHYGVDLAMPTGEPIYAVWDGVVRISKYNKSYGNLIVVRHANGLETYYAHMSKRMVEVGEPVKAGQTLGLCGNTGRSYGSHLHFEIRYLGNALNPENVIDCTTHKMINENLYITKNSFRKVAKPGTGNPSTTYSKNGAQYYKVRSGDTLSKIAKRNGTTVRKLCQLNGIKETTVLSVGRRLRIR